MEDNKIVGLFEERKEEAIRELERKYRGLCYQIVWNILHSHEDRSA